MRWIAHRGLASGRPGGTPTRQTLQSGIDLAADMIELDVHLTADAVLVVRHDTTVARRRHIETLTYGQLKLADPSILTLDEVGTFVAGRIPLLLDVKGERTVAPLAAWLARQQDPAGYTVCSPRLADFQTFQAVSPSTPRWATFPDVDGDARGALRRIIAALAHRRREGEINQMLRDVIRAARDILRDRNGAITNLGGLPWRDGLPKELAEVQLATGATGISVHQWLVTPALVDAAHLLGMTVTAWTVNRTDALGAVVRAGVDYVTSDDVEGMRRGLSGARRRNPPPPGFRPPSPLVEPPSLDPPDREVA